MKGNAKVIRELNNLLAEELTAIAQYMVHSEMCDNWGYELLHAKVEQRARQEMHHAEKLIARILFLEGVPIVSKLNAMKIGPDVSRQLSADLEAEVGAVKSYNEAIHLADETGDAVSRTLLEEILKDEDAHVDWLEAQLDQIKQMGLQNYLTIQTHE